jgi:hypothetical protein
MSVACLFELINHSAVFFSHNKLVNTTFCWHFNRPFFSEEDAFLLSGD